MLPYFDLTGRIAIVTGGAGLLGKHHCKAIASAGGIPITVDIQGGDMQADITDRSAVERVCEDVLNQHGRIDILINNAANNPKVEDGSKALSRVENFPIDQWNDDMNVGLLGAFHCCQIFGGQMMQQKSGVILNIASDLSVIAPDQRLYKQDGIKDAEQPVKPITYSVVKTGLIGLTRYFATYYAPHIRVNALSPGGIEASQPKAFLDQIASRIPLERMANESEYEGAVVFLCSDASSYMTGQNLVIDGGRSCW